MELLKPYKLQKDDTIGIFTPSSPAYCANEELFLNGIKNIEKLGFKVKLGFLTEIEHLKVIAQVHHKIGLKNLWTLLETMKLRL